MRVPTTQGLLPQTSGVMAMCSALSGGWSEVEACVLITSSYRGLFGSINFSMAQPPRRRRLAVIVAPIDAEIMEPETLRQAIKPALLGNLVTRIVLGCAYLQGF